MTPACVSNTSAILPSGLAAAHDRLTMYVSYSPCGRLLFAIGNSVLGWLALPRIGRGGAGVISGPADGRSSPLVPRWCRLGIAVEAFIVAMTVWLP